MRLRVQDRAHALDWFARLGGSRLLTLDVWVEATADEARKLKRFNMLNQDFFVSTEEASPVCLWPCSVVAGIAAWCVGMTTLGFGLAMSSVALFWMGWRTLGREVALVLKVKDVVNRKVPFTVDNPAAIHEIALQIDDQYQRLFGAMFEIEHFGVVRDVEWNREEVAA